MEDYLGEAVLKSLKGTSFEGFGPTEWALEFVLHYGQIDGAHHKQWVLDQVARILNGTPVIVSLAQWANGTKEIRFHTGEPSKKYLEWVKRAKGEDEEEYGYEEGSALDTNFPNTIAHFQEP